MAVPLYHQMIASNDAIFVAEQSQFGNAKKSNSWSSLLYQNSTPLFQVSKENMCTEFPEWLREKAIDLVIVFWMFT